MTVKGASCGPATVPLTWTLAGLLGNPKWIQSRFPSVVRLWSPVATVGVLRLMLPGGTVWVLTVMAAMPSPAKLVSMTRMSYWELGVRPEMVRDCAAGALLGLLMTS